MKKIIPILILSVMVMTLSACQSMMEREIKKGMNRQKVGMLTDGKLHVVLVGSGGPIVNTKRCSTSVAIMANGEFILVDVGPGSVRNADLQDLPLAALTGVFLTHFHSDHIAELGEANFQSWAQGRQKALAVYGPAGVDKVVQGFTLAYEQDTTYRIEHHGEATMPPAASRPEAKTISFKDPARAELFFDRNGLKAYAFLVDHAPVKPAVGYRFEYKGNVVVLTGDTKKIDILTQQAKNADLLICEALSFKTTALIGKVASENNRPRFAKIMSDILDYHMSPVQAGELARDAGAKKLVFYHIAPPVPNFLAKRLFLEGVSDVYKGEIILGEDGMAFTLDPRQ
jgi:ribonuclease Z